MAIKVLYICHKVICQASNEVSYILSYWATEHDRRRWETDIYS